MSFFCGWLTEQLTINVVQVVLSVFEDEDIH